MRRPATKIIATIGPNTESSAKIRQLIRAGVSVFRFNLKHNTVDWHLKNLKKVKQITLELETSVATLYDLQGPEMRINLKSESLRLQRGQLVELVSKEPAQENQVEVDPSNVLKHLKPGQIVYIADGIFKLEVVSVKSFDKVLVKVRRGGLLKTRKGINFPGLNGSLPSLTAEDHKRLDAIPNGLVDWVALSFVRSRRDVLVLRKELAKRKLKARIISKLESQEAIDNLEEILEETDAVMIARGDLGIEIPIVQVPYWQRRIINQARQMAKPVIVATQMMESMIVGPHPTRAEIADIAEAAHQGASATMLSGETAYGKYPIKAVSLMRQTLEFQEKHPLVSNEPFINSSQAEAVSQAAVKLADTQYCQGKKVAALVILTETGKTAYLIARHRPQLPLYALSRFALTTTQLNLAWGIKPLYYDYKKNSNIKKITRYLLKETSLKKGQRIILVHGTDWGTPGQTSVVSLHTL